MDGMGPASTAIPDTGNNQRGMVSSENRDTHGVFLKSVKRRESRARTRAQKHMGLGGAMLDP